MIPRIEDHPTVTQSREKQTERKTSHDAAEQFDANWLQSLAVEYGASDAGLVQTDLSQSS